MLRRRPLDRHAHTTGDLLERFVYGGLNRVDWREITVDRIRATAADVDSQLAPMLRRDVRPAKADIAVWSETLVRETRELMAAVLPFEAHELEFLERLNGRGDISPELLTSDRAVQAVIQDHPGLKWKALSVKRRLGADALDE